MRELVLLGRRNCPLCDRVRLPLAELAPARGLSVRELDVDRDPELRRRYTDRVPVLLLGELVIAEGRFDPLTALLAAGGSDEDARSCNGTSR